MTVELRRIDQLKLALKSIFRHNRANQLVLLCLVLLSLIPGLLFTVAHSTLQQIEASHRLVFGVFSDIYHDRAEMQPAELNLSTAKIESLLPGFHYSSYGAIINLATIGLAEQKTLRVGYIDEAAFDLAAIVLVEGSFPHAADEIVLTLSMAAELKAGQIGSVVDIGGSTYRVSGLIRDFGNLWPVPETMQMTAFGPVNALVSETEARRLLQDNPAVTRQILFVRAPGAPDPTDAPPSFMRNINSSLDRQSAFQVPLQFISLMALVAFLPLILIFVLNKKRLGRRIRTYHQLGLTRKAITAVLRAEHGLLTLLGAAGGLASCLLLAPAALRVISSWAGMAIALSVDWTFLAVLLAAVFAGNLLLNNLFCQRSLKTELAGGIGLTALSPAKSGRLQPLRHAVRISRGGLALLLAVIMLVYCCIAFGLFYGKIYHRDLNQPIPGQLPKDYDFLFFSAVEPAEPNTGKDKPFYFTTPFESLGGSAEFIRQLNALPAVERVLAYQEIDKLNVLLKVGQLDDYIDGNDMRLDGRYNMMLQTRIADPETFFRLYGYDADDMLVGASVIAYPETVLQNLSPHVSEGRINPARLASGEEVILRVPAYQLKKHDTSSNLNAMAPIARDHPEALNSTTFQVGDTLILSGLVNRERLTGAIVEDQADSFERIDLKVRIGAIIRESYGLLPRSGFSLDAFSILTIAGAFEALGLDARYSNIAVYTSPDYSDEAAREMILDLAPLVPGMKVLDLRAENQSMRIFNLLTRLFTASFLTAIILAALIILISQIAAHIRLNLNNYALLRINGLSLARLVRAWLLQILTLCGLGSLAGALLALLLMGILGNYSPNSLLAQILWDFPVENFAWVFLIVLSILAIATGPGLLILFKRRKEILLD